MEIVLKKVLKLILLQVNNFFLFIGINFLTNNFKNFNDENLVMENYLNNPNFIENNLIFDTLNLNKNSYCKFLPYKNNSISGFNYEK